MALPEGITAEEISRFAKLDEGIKKLQEEHKALGDKIKEAYGKKGTYISGIDVLKVGETSRLDGKLAEASLPFATNPELYEPKISSAKIKAELSKDAYEPLFNTSLTLSVSKAE